MNCPVGYRAAERLDVLPLTERGAVTMDLNDLYQRHQISLFMAENGSSEEVRQIHREFGRRYAERIADAKRAHLSATAA